MNPEVSSSVEERLRLWFSIQLRESRQQFAQRVKVIRHAATQGVMVDKDGQNPQQFFTGPSQEPHSFAPWVATGPFIKRHIEAAKIEFECLSQPAWAKAIEMVGELPTSLIIVQNELQKFLNEMREELVRSAQLSSRGDEDGSSTLAMDQHFDETVRLRFDEEAKMHLLGHGRGAARTQSSSAGGTADVELKAAVTKPKPYWYPALDDEFKVQDKRFAKWALDHPERSLPVFPSAAKFRQKLISRGFPEEKLAPSTVRYHVAALKRIYGR